MKRCKLRAVGSLHDEHLHIAFAPHQTDAHVVRMALDVNVDGGGAYPQAANPQALQRFGERRPEKPNLTPRCIDRDAQARLNK